MEIGEFSIKHLKDTIAKEDMDVSMKCGIVMHGGFGSLIALREFVQKTYGVESLVYFTISSQPLYVVHRNDLSDKKKEEIEQKRSGK
jgi:hypothetical protein